MLYEYKFLLALGITLIIEVPIVWILFKKIFKFKKVKTFKLILIALLASISTLPYLWFILPIFIKDGSLFFIIGEVLVVFIEALIYKTIILKTSKAFLISLIANIASFSLGLIIF